MTDDEWDDEGPTTETCRHCGEEVYEDAPQCPGCGAYDFAARGGTDGPLFKVLLFLAVVVALTFAFGGLGRLFR